MNSFESTEISQERYLAEKATLSKCQLGSVKVRERLTRRTRDKEIMGGFIRVQRSSTGVEREWQSTDRGQEF